jgi:hypothetical protein
LPKLAEGQEDAFSPKCGKIAANTYDFKRTINLPGRKELEDKIKQKINGVDGEIRKRLNKGVGFWCFAKNIVILAREIPSVFELD